MKKGLLACQHYSDILVIIRINLSMLFLRTKLYIMGLVTKLVILKECFEVNLATNRLNNLY